jgi:hypothetical protein
LSELLSDVHGMKSPDSFLGVLTDQIIDHGAPTKLISDSAKVETSMAVCDILHMFSISSRQSEPYHQHQNPAKWHYQTVKCILYHPWPHGHPCLLLVVVPDVCLCHLKEHICSKHPCYSLVHGHWNYQWHQSVALLLFL